MTKIGAMVIMISDNNKCSTHDITYDNNIGDADENDGDNNMVTIVPAVATAARLLLPTSSTL